MVAWNPNRLLKASWGTHGPRNSSDVDESHRKSSRNPWWLMMLILNHFWWYWDAFWWSLLEKNNSRPLPVRQCADSVFRVFCAKPQGLRHEGFWSSQWYPHHWDYGWSWVFCFFAGWIPFGQGAGFLDFTLDCAFCGVSRNFQKLLTSSQRRQISA